MIDLMELDAAGSGAGRRCRPDPRGAGGARAQGRADATPPIPQHSRRLGVGRRLALAGGLGVRDVPAVARWGDVRLIVGSSVTAAADPAAAAAELRAAITLTQEQS